MFDTSTYNNIYQFPWHQLNTLDNYRNMSNTLYELDYMELPHELSQAAQLPGQLPVHPVHEEHREELQELHLMQLERRECDT